MHSGFDQIPGQEHLCAVSADENGCAAAVSPSLLPMNQTQILEQTHNLHLAHQLFLHQHDFLLPHAAHRMHHQYVCGAAGAVSPAFFPVNFKLGLNEACPGDNDHKVSAGEGPFLRGSNHFLDSDSRRFSLKMQGCWQNQQDSDPKLPPFWETQERQRFNKENSEMAGRRLAEMSRHEETPTNCYEIKTRQIYGGLEEIYNKRLGIAECDAPPGDTHDNIMPSGVHLPAGLQHGSDASIGEEASEISKSSKKKRKQKANQANRRMVAPMTRFFESLVKQVLDHQENLHRKFTQMVEKMDEERRQRDEAWRNQESSRCQETAAARAREKSSAACREAAIVSYLEKISGHRIDLPSLDPTELTSTNTSDDFPRDEVHGED